MKKKKEVKKKYLYSAVFNLNRGQGDLNVLLVTMRANSLDEIVDKNRIDNPEHQLFTYLRNKI